MISILALNGQNARNAQIDSLAICLQIVDYESQNNCAMMSSDYNNVQV